MLNYISDRTSKVRSLSYRCASVLSKILFVTDVQKSYTYSKFYELYCTL